MQKYLDALAQFESLSPDTLVLPSHGLPRTVCAACPAARASSVATDDVASVVTGKTCAFAIAQEVFPRVLYDNPRQAFGESLAHLNMLASMGRLTRDVGATGSISFAPM